MAVIGKNRDRKSKAKVAYNVLNDKTAFDALSDNQRMELLRRALVFLLKRELKDEVE